MNLYYYNANERKGPFNQSQIKNFAASGMIVRDTIIETDTGKRFKASNIKGMIFKESVFQETVLPPSGFVQVPVPQIQKKESKEKTIAPGINDDIPIDPTSVMPSQKILGGSVPMKITAFLFFILAVICFCNGVSTLSAEAREIKTAKDKLDFYEKENKYVGGDAYNYIINGNYFTGYNVKALHYTILRSGYYICSALFLCTAAILFWLPSCLYQRK